MLGLRHGQVLPGWVEHLHDILPRRTIHPKLMCGVRRGPVLRLNDGYILDYVLQLSRRHLLFLRL